MLRSLETSSHPLVTFDKKSDPLVHIISINTQMDITQSSLRHSE